MRLIFSQRDEYFKSQDIIDYRRACCTECRDCYIILMKLLECSEQSIQLRGYSRTSGFQLRNLHPHLYVTFKVELQLAAD